MSLEQAAKAIELNAARGQTGAARLAILEAGNAEISRQLLGRMAEKYRRPLITFYLAAPPPPGERGEDFRRSPKTAPQEFNPQLDTLIRNVRARQDVVRFLLEDDESEPLPFVGSSKIADGVDSIARGIIETTGFDLAEFRRSSDIDKAFAYLRDRLEQSGIFVLLLGDLGSHHSKIESRAFRGYAIADPIAPFIVINDNDARSAWSFTALHEAAHVWLGQTGLSGASHEAAVERFCNDVAGAILLPAIEVRAIDRTRLRDWENTVNAIGEFAAERNISRAMVAYSLLREGKITTARYRDLDDHFYGAWLKTKEKKRDKDEERRGPNRYVILRHRLGPALVGLARQYVESGSLSPTKASSLLGVKPSAVRTFLHPEGAR
ncbi:ImmA/IrrE family metallo-endopeptidase [Hyphomicrobium sp. GJ21]|uniref:ImmA/IrrE family metallo-endopeptidase n=1 Tax=Hyphomicrobium sp. GJ21 TaxID=113574 RepID=UPI001FCCE8A7|nr:ImmA/IrrE family metallo-endopeptidase [Hyphomicrobium sp. GJ21]